MGLAEERHLEWCQWAIALWGWALDERCRLLMLSKSSRVCSLYTHHRPFNDGEFGMNECVRADGEERKENFQIFAFQCQDFIYLECP